MRTFFSEDHRFHFPQAELSGGQFVTPFERPSRVEYVLARLKERGLTDIVDPGPADMAPIRALLDSGYLDFLENGFAAWKAAGNAGEMLPFALPARRMRSDLVPKTIEGKAGFYCLASETAITAGTWRAALSSAASAQAATRHVLDGAKLAFALCRPPGHHASSDQFGGYCFINNAAVAAQLARDAGVGRVAILDVDFHHGNGTQDIFYGRGDVLFVSLHGDPAEAFPFHLGHADETGTGAGEGANINYPLPRGTEYAAWSAALDDALARIRDWGADLLVLSLGVDAYKEDPISFFRLDSPDFTDMGRRIGALGLPTAVCFEGGYAIEQVGINAVNLLEGLEERLG